MLFEQNYEYNYQENMNEKNEANSTMIKNNIIKFKYM